MQGVGNVGYHLCKYLANAGAKLTVTDIYPEQVDRVAKEFKAAVVAPEAIYQVDCDIFAPCALGAILNSRTISQLHCKIVAGSANNQLESDADGAQLARLGILYAPDYVINAGGLINVAAELDGYKHELVLSKVGKIYNTIDDIFEQCKKNGVLPHQAAEAIAERKLQEKRAEREARWEMEGSKGINRSSSLNNPQRAGGWTKIVR
jgi:leucine dehydrogenase